MELNTSDPMIRRNYAEIAAQRHKAVLRTIRAAGIDALKLSTDQPYLPALLGFFRTRKRRLDR